MVKEILSCDNLKNSQLMSVASTWLCIALFGVALLTVSVSARAETVSKEQIKGLDEQVQEIKGDVLAIAAELSHLEEKLLFPSNTQVAVFVSLQADDGFLLDSLEIRLNGEAVAYHLYSYRELEALKKGGVQRIYTGNLGVGQHEMQVTMLGRSKGGSDLNHSESFRVEKSVGPKAVEINLAGPGLAGKTIGLKEI
jgi:hypothetical protein